jgi:predicted enzyme related to lactoylglutathione lyase
MIARNVMRSAWIGALTAFFFAAFFNPPLQAADTASVGVAPQYDATHVYVAPHDMERFASSFVATFGGQATRQMTLTVTPTPSSTLWQGVQTPAGMVSLFGFTTPIPYPFGLERTGYLVTDIEAAIKSARDAGADVIVQPFPDPVGRDAVIQFPGGINTQLYWHTTRPNYAALQTIPENRVYVSPDRIGAFTRSFLAFSHGKIISDYANAPGIEIGNPKGTYRRLRIESVFGKLTALVTDGHLVYPYGRELSGYEVANVADTLTKAKNSGATVLVPPFTADARLSAMVQFPGGYIAEIHSKTP